MARPIPDRLSSSTGVCIHHTLRRVIGGVTRRDVDVDGAARGGTVEPETSTLFDGDVSNDGRDDRCGFLFVLGHASIAAAQRYVRHEPVAVLAYAGGKGRVDCKGAPVGRGCGVGLGTRTPA